MLGFAASRKWVYAMPVEGSLRHLRRGTSLILLLILFVTPWITVGGHPALLLDLPSRRLFAFGAIFTASDTVLLLLMLLFLAFCLFFFTALFGRLWCGYACPQTVFLEEFIRPLERWIEGSRGVWIHRDEATWTLGKAARKAAKWTVFGAAAGISASLRLRLRCAPIPTILRTPLPGTSTPALPWSRQAYDERDGHCKGR